MRNRRTDAIVIKSPNNKNNNSPFSPSFENQRLPKPPGPTLANMGPYSQATTEATKSIVDRELCQLLTY